MKFIDIHSVPKFRFAHEHSADSYQKIFESINSIIEISYILDGEVSIEKYGEKYTAARGDIMCNLYDDISYVSSACFHRHRTVCVNVGWTFTDNQSTGLFIPPIIHNRGDADDVIMMIDDFVVRTYRYNTCEARCAHGFLDILCKIDEIARKRNNVHDFEVSLWADRAKKYIQKNIHSPITQTEVAQYLGISSGYLCSVFKKSEGITLMKYINSLKLKSIRGLVETKRMKLYEAAAMYGYSDANYVSSLYRKMFGHNITDSAQSSDVSMVDLKS